MTYPHKRDKIIKLLSQRRMSQKAQSKSQVRVFADEEEKAEIKENHEANIKFMKAFLAKINHSKRNSVLDACCGDGRVIVALLAERYSIVDGFDQDLGPLRSSKTIPQPSSTSET